MKFKEYISLFKNLIKSKSLIILKCPYCDSFDITLVKDTLKEKEGVELAGVKDLREIGYVVGCNKCGSVGAINEHWIPNKK